jgi:hypothetical protein
VTDVNRESFPTDFFNTSEPDIFGLTCKLPGIGMRIHGSDLVDVIKDGFGCVMGKRICTSKVVMW